MSQFSDLASDYENSLLEYSPDLGHFWGKSNIALDRFTDASLEGYTRWLKQEDDFLLK